MIKLLIIFVAFFIFYFIPLAISKKMNRKYKNKQAEIQKAREMFLMKGGENNLDNVFSNPEIAKLKFSIESVKKYK